MESTVFRTRVRSANGRFRSWLRSVDGTPIVCEADTPARAIRGLLEAEGAIAELLDHESRAWDGPVRRWAAFIDLLGFSSTQREIASLDAKVRAKALKRIRSLRWLLEFDDDTAAYSNLAVEASPYADLRVTSCSDAVFATAADNASGFIAVLHFAQAYAYRALVESGFLVRGAIAFGPVLHTRAVVMGPPIVEAVDVEKTVGHPVIALSDSAVQELQLQRAELENCGIVAGSSVLFTDALGHVLSTHLSWAESAVGDVEAAKRRWTNQLLRPMRRRLGLLVHTAESGDDRVKQKVRYTVDRFNAEMDRGPMAGFQPRL
jgi:hypothetical protein